MVSYAKASYAYSYESNGDAMKKIVNFGTRITRYYCTNNIAKC